MRDLLVLAIHMLVTCVKLLQPGGVRAVAAESLLLKHPEITTMRIVCIARLAVPRPITALVHRFARLLRSNITPGNIIAAGYFRLR